jgi:2-oxoglutarate dehydrogenase E1 component
VKLPYRKPLVVFTPKSLLRHSACVSPLADFASGTRFQEVLDDPAADPKSVERLIFCSGKVCYDLFEKKHKDNRRDVAIVRIEQLYPFPKTQMQTRLQKHAAAKQRLWVQEEPENMGAWPFLRTQEVMAGFEAVSRAASGSAATGFPARHQQEQQALIERAFA